MGRTLSSDSANVIALPASPTGFTAGDYVYRTTAGYGAIPDAALATGVFDKTIATPVFGSTATTSNQFTYVEQLGGSTGSQVAALLTNGNIVYVYASGNTAAGANATVNFKIETAAGVSVVAETSTTMTAYTPYQVSVVAISNGTFAIVCTPLAANFSLSARFYNNDGTAATAVLAGSFNFINAQSVGRLKLQARSDNSVIIGYTNNAVFELRRVTTAGFDATFGASGVATVYNIGSSPNQFWDYVVDSSSNIQLIFLVSGTAIIMRRYNSIGVQQTSSTISTGLTGVTAAAVAITSDGTIRGFIQQTAGINVITWNGTTAALGTQIVAGNSSDGAALGAFAQGASGGYVVIYTSLTTQGTNPLNVQVFDSSNVALASAATLISGQTVSCRTQFTPIIISGDTRIYFGLFQNAVNYVGGTTSPPMGLAYFAYNNTSYAILNTTTANVAYTGLGPFALGNYTRSASTPGGARFTIASTGTYSATIAAGTISIPKTVIDGTNTSRQLVMAPLSTGEFVAAWNRSGTSFATLIAKYSATGALVAGPVTVSATGASNSFRAVSVATFANGNIIVTYSTAGTSLQFIIYTSSLTVVTSGTIDTTNLATDATAVISSFGPGTHVAIAYPEVNGYFAYKVVSNAGVVSSALNTFTASAAWGGLSVVGLKANGFVVYGNNTSAAMSAQAVRQTGPTTFVLGTAYVFNSADTISSSRLCSPIPAVGTAAYRVGSTSTALTITSVNPLANATGQVTNITLAAPFTGSIGSSAADWGAAIGYTGTGTPVIVSSRNNSGRFLTLAPFTLTMTSTTGTVTLPGSVITTLATSSLGFISVIPGNGENIIIGFIDSNQYPAFVSISAAPYIASTTLTVGTDISTSTLNLTPEAGYSLQGISVTAAASGNSGLVQARGTAALNSNYSAATPATFFDFRNPLIFGTNGTVVGRTVTMGNN